MGTGRSPRRAARAVTGALGATATALWLLLAVTAPATAAPVGGSFTFTGGGFGHGVGMSQYGARGYADAVGWSAEQILSHYYTGTRTIQAPSPALRVWLADVGASTTFDTSGPLPLSADNAPGSAPVLVDTRPAGSTPVTIRRAASGGLEAVQNGSVVAGPVPGPLVVSPQAGPATDCATGTGTLRSAPCLGLPATALHYHYGAVEFSALGSGIRVVVRDIPMQAYLYGLGEMPSSWNAEALQAQAVAARSYAQQKAGVSGSNRPDCSCTVRATTADQAYIGVEKQAETTFGQRWRAAVDATDGTIVTVDGSTPIQALYSSSSGGRTEANEDYFGGTPLPYLRSVPDDGDAVSSNPNHRWTRSYTGSELSRWLGADGRTATGDLQNLQLGGGLTAGGRPRQMVVTGSSRTVAVPLSVFRSVVNAGAAADGRPTFLSAYVLTLTSPQPVCNPVSSPARELPMIRRGGVWHVRAAYASGPADSCFGFGDPSDVAVTGDWDGDGRRTVGVWRPSTATWYLRNGTAGGPAEVVVRYGAPGDVPVVGDWNDDGRDSLGVFRPSTGAWHLSNSVAAGTADAVFGFGSPGDTPVVGDWNGDGTDTLGVVRNGTWYLTDRLTPGPSVSQVSYRFGTAGDRPVVGDWNGDGVDTSGVFRSGQWHLTNRRGGPAEAVFSFGSPADTPLVWGW